MNLPRHVDIAVIGGGAAGLMAAIWAKRTNPDLNIVILDGARKPGAKILIAGGGRCNVTHYKVHQSDYAGTSENSIKKVLLRFNVAKTIEFFEQLGVKLKKESTGKLFPVSDCARDVLNALIKELQRLNIKMLAGHRVESLSNNKSKFMLEGNFENLMADKVILASGGMSLPKSGSDGKGYALSQSLGHNLTNRIFPALVPLLISPDHFICRLSGLSLTAQIKVVNVNNKVLTQFTNSVLCTHFGISGPGALDISRYWLDALNHDADAQLIINWLPEIEQLDFEQELISGSQAKSIRNYLNECLPSRLVDVLCNLSDIDKSCKSNQLPKVARKKLLAAIFSMPLPVTGDRGFRYAEVTAGGVPLSELDLKTMESRIVPGLFYCGEICDVDGRIGGFNFQWAWASGYVSGVAGATPQ